MARFALGTAGDGVPVVVTALILRAPSCALRWQPQRLAATADARLVRVDGRIGGATWPARAVKQLADEVDAAIGAGSACPARYRIMIPVAIAAHGIAKYIRFWRVKVHGDREWVNDPIAAPVHGPSFRPQRVRVLAVIEGDNAGVAGRER